MRTSTRRPRSQAGFSLVEMLIALVVAGLLFAMAVPKLRDTIAARDVKSARSALANMYARARMNALQTRKSTTVHFDAGRTWVTAPLGAGLDTVGAVVDLATMYGITLTASAASVTVLPTGLANMSTATTVTVARSGKSDSVVISGYGRLK